jgi:hypothetical protein
MGLLTTPTTGHRSFSSFTSWVKCGKAWQLERELRVPSEGAWYFVGGSAFHLAVEKILKGEVELNVNND